MKTGVITTDAFHKGYIIAKALAQEGVDVCLGGTHWSDPGLFSRYVKERFTYPKHYKTTEDVFVDRLSEIVRRKSDRFGVFLPAAQYETLMVAKYRKRFEPYVKLCLPPYEKMELCHDKSKLREYAKVLGIPVPKILSEMTAIGKVVIKPSFALQSGCVLYANGVHELNRKSALVESPIVQEYVPGVGFGVEVLYDHGNLVAMFTHQRIRECPLDGGIGAIRMGVHRQDIEAYTQLLFDELQWHGVAMAEWRVNGSDVWLLEVNPRFWGSLHTAVVAGVNFPYLAYQVAQGEPVTVKPYVPGMVTEYFLANAKAVAKGFWKRKLLKNTKPICVDSYDDIDRNDPATTLMYLVNLVTNRKFELLPILFGLIVLLVLVILRGGF